MHEELVPPDDEVGVPGSDASGRTARHSERMTAPWTMERDVLAALRELGHDVLVVGVADEIAEIRRTVEDFQPNVIFNCTVQFLDVGAYDAHVVSYFELLRAPYTGCNPRGLVLAGDKALSKKILEWHGVSVPRFAVYPRGKAVRMAPGLAFPLIVKSTAEQASLGISQASVVHDQAALAKRVAFVHEHLGTDAIAEQYILGRELTVGVLGNDRLQVLPVWEMTFDSLPDSAEPIATSRVKWDVEYQKKIGLRTHAAEDLPPEVERSIARMAGRIYRALDMSGYGRIDLRMDEAGRIFVLEANPNPDLTADEDFAVSAARVGIEYPQLIQRVLNLGMGYDAAWKASA